MAVSWIPETINTTQPSKSAITPGWPKTWDTNISKQAAQQIHGTDTALMDSKPRINVDTCIPGISRWPLRTALPAIYASHEVKRAAFAQKDSTFPLTGNGKTFSTLLAAKALRPAISSQQRFGQTPQKGPTSTVLA